MDALEPQSRTPFLVESGQDAAPRRDEKLGASRDASPEKCSWISTDRSTPFAMIPTPWSDHARGRVTVCRALS